MNRRYMDFVPSSKKIPAKKTVGRRVVPDSRNISSAKKPIIKNVVQNTNSTPVQKSVPKPSLNNTILKEATLGVIEEVSPRYVKTATTKNVLTEKPHFTIKASVLTEAKATKVGNKSSIHDKREEASSEKVPAAQDQKTFKTPKTPFINQDKVIKRPLSKNVYPKKIVPVNEEPKGPITIIDKTEKDSKIGLIITVILTIILGAAAGTVAFLLLPK